VAQNRQRQRRRRDRQPGAGGPAAGSGRTDPRDSGLEPTDTDLGGTTPAPEPTKHAFPDVEEARLAEAGPVERGEGAEIYPDEVTDDAYEPAPDFDAATAAPGARRAQVEREPRGGGNRVFTFLGHVVDELRRVQWPDRKHVGQSTLVVLLFVIIAGGYLGLLDALIKPVVDAIL
jgi:preprotein translocase SecE subunit